MTRFTILGLLSRDNMSGYDISCHVTRYFSHIVKISNSTLYYLLVRMEKDKLIREIKKNGEKTHSKKIFSITSKGKETFNNLLGDIAQMQFYDPFQIALIFFDSADKSKIKEIIDARLKLYDEIEEKINSKLKKVPKNHEEKNTYFNFAIKRGKSVIDADRKILQEIRNHREA